MKSRLFPQIISNLLTWLYGSEWAIVEMQGVKAPTPNTSGSVNMAVYGTGNAKAIITEAVEISSIQLSKVYK